MNGDYLIVTDSVKKTVDDVFKFNWDDGWRLKGLTWTNNSYFTIFGTDVKIYVLLAGKLENMKGLHIRRIYVATPFIRLEYLDSVLDAVCLTDYDCVLHCFMKHIYEDIEQDKLTTAINNEYGVHSSKPRPIDISGLYPWHIQKQLLDAEKLQKDIEETAQYQILFNPVTAGVLQDIDYQLRKRTTCGLIDTKEYNKMMNYSKMIKDVIFNDPATIIIWKDGTKTVVRNSDDTPYDPEKGFAMAITKKALGNEGNYYDIFKKYVPTISIPKDIYIRQWTKMLRHVLGLLPPE